MLSLSEVAMAMADPSRLTGFTKVGKLPTKFGFTLPTRLNEVSIMTIKEVYVALGGSENEAKEVSGPRSGYFPIYYMYTVYDIQGFSKAPISSTLASLKDISIDWYTKLKEPATNDSCWVTTNHTVIGGPLRSIYHDDCGYYGFNWDCSDDRPGSIDVADSAYVAIVRVRPSKDDLPTNPGDVSIMTIAQAYEALGGPLDGVGAKDIYDPTCGYNTSTYHIYAINDNPGERDSRLSTIANLETIDVNWYKQLNKPATSDNHWTNIGNSPHSIFGGPLININRGDGGTYYFHWCYTEGYNRDGYSFNDEYWRSFVDRNVYVVLVRAK